MTPEIAAQVSAVYGCCRLIVDSLAPAPIVVYEVGDEGERTVLHDDRVSWLMNYGAPVGQFPDAPTAQAVEEGLLWSALLGNGNAYAEIQRDASRRPVALWPIETERVLPRRDASGYWYEIRQPDGTSARLESMDCYHLRGPSLFGWMGDGQVYRAAKAIGIAHAAQVFSASYFSNGAVPSGVLTSEQKVTQEQANDAIDRWNEAHGGGPTKAHALAVLGQGLKYETVSHDAQKSQLIEARRFQVAEIARFYGVPLTLLAENEAWTNLAELYIGFYRNALRPWAERLDAEATRKLFPQAQPWRVVEHDLTHLTQGSFKDLAATCGQLVKDRIWTVNEARGAMGKNPVPGGDEIEKVQAPQPSPLNGNGAAGPPNGAMEDAEDDPGEELDA